MTVLRSIIAALGLGLLVYTLAVIPQHGINLLPVFLGDVFAVNWSGQFNLDFASYLLLSGLWVAWRGGFSRVSRATRLTGLVQNRAPRPQRGAAVAAYSALLDDTRGTRAFTRSRMSSCPIGASPSMTR